MDPSSVRLTDARVAAFCAELVVPAEGVQAWVAQEGAAFFIELFEAFSGAGPQPAGDTENTAFWFGGLKNLERKRLRDAVLREKILADVLAAERVELAGAQIRQSSAAGSPQARDEKPGGTTSAPVEPPVIASAPAASPFDGFGDSNSSSPAPSPAIVPTASPAVDSTAQPPTSGDGTSSSSSAAAKKRKRKKKSSSDNSGEGDTTTSIPAAAPVPSANNTPEQQDERPPAQDDERGPSSSPSKKKKKNKAPASDDKAASNEPDDKHKQPLTSTQQAPAQAPSPSTISPAPLGGGPLDLEETSTTDVVGASAKKSSPSPTREDTPNFGGAMLPSSPIEEGLYKAEYIDITDLVELGIPVQGCGEMITSANFELEHTLNGLVAMDERM